MSRELIHTVLLPDQARMHLVESATVTEGKDGVIKLRGIGIQGDVKNQNGRIYPKEEIARAVQEMTQRIQKHGPIPGECDHPDNMTIALERITHLIDAVYMDGTDGIVEMRVIPTILGQTVQAMIKCGLKIGVSSRGTGEVDQAGRVSNFEILTIDMVANPSAPDAYPKPVLESLQGTSNGRRVLNLAEAVQEDPSAQRYMAKEIRDFITQVLSPKGHY